MEVIYRCICCGKEKRVTSKPSWVKSDIIGDKEVVKCVCDDCRINKYNIKEDAG